MTSLRQNAPDQGVFHERVAEEVRAIFARRQINARQVARTLGWTDNYISRRLTGKIPMDVNDLEALSRAIGVPLTSFFPDTILDGRSSGGGWKKWYFSTPGLSWPVSGRPDIATVSTMDSGLSRSLRAA